MAQTTINHIWGNVPKMSLSQLKKEVELFQKTLNVEVEPFNLIVIDGKTVSLKEGIEKLIEISRANPCQQ